MGPGALVRLATGDDVRMDELRPGASLHCPYHDDEHPSAFAVRSEQGAVGVHCSVCKVTFWPNNDRDAYDFDAFDKIFEEGWSLSSTLSRRRRASRASSRQNRSS